MINVLFSAKDRNWDQYHSVIPEACAELGLTINMTRDIAPSDVDYIVFAPNPALTDFSPYTNCKAVLSLWAGVETIAPNPTLQQPLCRLVDPGLEQGMVEWVTGHVLRYHLGMDAHITATDQVWRPEPAPLATSRRVTILGLGALGAACARMLGTLGFEVNGWSQSQKTIDGVTCWSGADGLNTALARADILVLLLPLTGATSDILNADTLALMPKGAFVINPGRGALIEDAALLDALDTGQIAHATLDVFRNEPLPADNAFWHHPRVTVTPHIASETRPETAARRIAENIRRGEAGEPFLNLVDRDRGY